MKLKILIPLLLLPSMLVGCNNKGKSEPKNTSGEVETTVPAMINSESSGYKVKFAYNDDHFKQSATVFNKDLMQLSYGASITTGKLDLLKGYFTTMGYDNLFANSDYIGEITENGIGTLFAHKKIDEFHLVAVTLRGCDYGKEWANNMEVGKEGNHVGFDRSARKVYDLLEQYLQQFKGENESTKLWINGYSRAGAIANVLASKIMTSELIATPKDNLFTYTFEAPRALTKENAVAYENVFNMVNSADLIARLLPEEYGLYRCGIDKEIYDEKFDEYLTALDSKIVIEKFEPDEENYPTEPKYADKVMSLLLEYEPKEDYDAMYPYMIHDRAHYVMLQDKIRYAINVIMSIPDCFNVLSKKFGDMGMMDILLLISDDGTNLYNLVKDLLDENKVLYDPDITLACCKALVNFAQRYLLAVASIIMTNNGKRLIKAHMTEGVYVLIKNYTEPAQA